MAENNQGSPAHPKGSGRSDFNEAARAFPFCDPATGKSVADCPIPSQGGLGFGAWMDGSSAPPADIERNHREQAAFGLGLSPATRESIESLVRAGLMTRIRAAESRADKLAIVAIVGWSLLAIMSAVAAWGWGR